MKSAVAVLLLSALAPLAASASGRVPQGMVRIQGGSFRPLYTQTSQPTVRVAPFAIDSVPVSQAQFLAFTRQQPKWSAMAQGADRKRAATNVSLEAAAAFCRARGARLPTTDEWEYVALASEQERNSMARPAFRQRVLELAMRTRGAHAIGSGLRNVWGVRDIHGGLHEWTSDVHHFGPHESHGSGHRNHVLSCGSGVAQTGDATDLAAFMRYATRATADTNTGSANIGFRCAR